MVHPVVRAALLAIVLLTVVAACGAGEGGVSVAEEGAADGGNAPAYAYEVFLEGRALTDTLRGPATFNAVVNGKTQATLLVVAMEAGVDLTSGFFLTHPGDERPAVGTYPIGPPADSLAGGAAPGFAAIYQEGMRRRLTSTGGTLRLTVATDTLLEGSFTADLRGTVALPGEPPRLMHLDARGTFRAEKGAVGFVVGL